MKKLFAVLLSILLIAFVSAIKINEVEMNPSGNDSGNEWIELYDKGNFNLNGYKLVNNDGDEIELGGNFSGYYIYIFNKQWLDNKDERIFLYDEELVDETDLFDDEENSDKTWQLCDNWKFAESTKGEKNDCGEEVDENLEDNISEDNNIEAENISNEKEEQETEKNIISLSTKDIKSFDEDESSSKTKYAAYGFVLLCVLLIVLFGIKYFKKNGKSEFE